ncbi:MAG TPA: response regulator [Polyangia bacterium]|jgi:two-component system response regulator RegA
MTKADAAPSQSILLVDDDDAFRERLARALRARGFSVVTAPNPPAAIAAASAHLPDFAVIDMRMPDASGQAVIDALGDVSPATKAVVLTGYGSIASAVEALHKGALHYLSKPIDADELVATLMNLEGETSLPGATVDVTPSLARAEWEHIQRVLTDCGGNVSEAARRLGIARRTLQLKLKKYPPRV